MVRETVWQLFRRSLIWGYRTDVEIVNLIFKHRQEYVMQGRWIAAILLTCLLGSFQSANAQNTNYVQPQMPGATYSQQYQAAPGPSQPLTVRTQINQVNGGISQSPWITPEEQSQVPPATKQTKRKGHPLLQKLGHAAGDVGSAAVGAAAVGARVGMAVGMRYAMYGGYGYGYNPMMYGRW